MELDLARVAHLDLAERHLSWSWLVGGRAGSTMIFVVKGFRVIIKFKMEIGRLFQSGSRPHLEYFSGRANETITRTCSRRHHGIRNSNLQTHRQARTLSRLVRAVQWPRAGTGFGAPKVDNVHWPWVFTSKGSKIRVINRENQDRHNGWNEFNSFN